MSSYVDTAKSESEQNDLENDDSQFTIAEGPVGFDSTASSTVLVLPPNLSQIRQQLFESENSITWSAQKFDQYWLFLDNIWVHNHTGSITKKQTQTSYWYCRSWKDESEKKSEGHSIQSNRMLGKASFQMFSITGTANHVLRIGDKWENRARKKEISFRTTMLAEAKDYPQLQKFPYPVQKLIVQQYKEAVQNNENGDEPAGEMSDELICPNQLYVFPTVSTPVQTLVALQLLMRFFS